MRVLPIMLLVAACGSSGGGNGSDANGDQDSAGSGSHDAPPGGPRTIFVIPMENKPSSQIYGNMQDAPYINGLIGPTGIAAQASMFKDELPSLDSEPHYIWMEGGTNVFTDHTFSNDNDASSSNSTSSTDHLSTLLDTAGVAWMSYQEGITSGSCPISSIGNPTFYATKHDPFVFFQDVSGSPPSKTNARCGAHHKAYADFVADLGNGLTGYVFITPNLCHDMHGDLLCPSGIGTASNIQAGDTWLAAELPRIIDYTKTHDALVLVTWDEGDSSNLIPFLAIGPGVKAGSTSSVMYSHSSLAKSVSEWLHAPVLASVASANDFADMFQPGAFP